MRDAAVLERPAPGAARSFFVWMAAACLRVALIRLLADVLAAVPCRDISSAHRCCTCTGLLFSAWPMYFLAMTVLAARGRITRHRAWGLLGISLATAMVLIGFAVANAVLSTRLPPGSVTARAPFTSRRRR